MYSTSLIYIVVLKSTVIIENFFRELNIIYDIILFFIIIMSKFVFIIEIIT